MGDRQPATIQGRRSEREALDRVLDDARSSRSATLVIRGEAGIGKTALLEDVARRASGFRVLRITGVESEMELAYGALHQLCRPLLALLDQLPAPQADALRVAFALAPGPAPDRFLVALATLGLLAQVTDEGPLLCLVEDAQWLDGVSGQALGFVARRLLAEPAAVVVAEREPATSDEFIGLPELRLGGLAHEDASALLAAVVPGRIDARVRDRMVRETRGNPLALLELTRGMDAAELAAGYASYDATDLPVQIERRYRERLVGLPEPTRLLMLVAAADPVADEALVWRAAETLGVGRDAAEPAAQERLLDVGTHLHFRHPLVRSAAYRSVSLDDRRAAHRALAVATDGEADADRRAWHRAQATAGLDDDVATDLERSADRARARGGLAATAAFLHRSAGLTADPGRRARRLVAAAEAAVLAGAFDQALRLLAMAAPGPLDEVGAARVALLRGRVAAATSAANVAPVALVAAARDLEPLDVALARGTYLDAWGAAMFAGHLAEPGGTLAEVCAAVRSAPRPTEAEGPSDVLLDGLAGLVVDGPAAAAPTLRRAVQRFRREDTPTEQVLQWGVLASSAAVSLWDFDAWDAVSARQIGLARAAGALGPLSVALQGQAMVATWCGDFVAAASLCAEDEALTEATDTRVAPYGTLLLTAYQGRPEVASTRVEAAIEASTASGEGLGVTLARWASAILHNGLGRHVEALAAARQARDARAGLFISTWALPELIEAATRTGSTDEARDGLRDFAEATAHTRAEWAMGMLARCRALVADGEAAEALHREAIDRLAPTRLRVELARSHLLYGEWLRRTDRRSDARAHLEVAFDLFSAMRADAFARRARGELAATGAKVRERRVDSRTELTSQEAHIARLARDGRTNAEIGAELYISARTVEWHLRKVFTKLGIGNRRGLREALPDQGPS